MKIDWAWLIGALVFTSFAVVCMYDKDVPDFVATILGVLAILIAFRALLGPFVGEGKNTKKQ